MTYSWQIVKFKTRDQVNADGVTLADAVVKIQWMRIGVDSDGNRGSVIGSVDLTAAHLGASDYIAFSDLTEAKVSEWLDTAIDSNLIESYNTKILEKMAAAADTERDVPWS